MTPSSNPPATPDAEFDIDVDVRSVDRRVTAEHGIRATECSCAQCDTNAASCTGCPG